MTYKELTESNSVVLVEFFASWCPQCQRMMPIVADVKKKVEGRATVAQFDIDEYNELSDQEGVETVPTFILYKNGKEVWRQSGEMPESELLEKVEGAF